MPKILPYKLFLGIFFAFVLLVLLIVPLFRYWQFEIYYYDFGIFDRLIYSLSNFKAPLIDKFLFSGTNYLSDHFTIGLVFLVPFYWLFPNSPWALLVIQSFSVWLAGIVAHHTIKDKLPGPAVLALLFAFYWFLGLQNAIITEFHSMVIAILPLMLMFWAIYKKENLVYFLSFLVFLLLKENLGFFSVFLGLWLLYKKRFKLGTITIFISILYSLTAIYLIIPFIGKHAYLYPPVYDSNFLDIVKNFFYPNIKIKTLFSIFASFGFLPFFYWPLSLGILFDLFTRFSLNNAPSRWNIGMHYNILYSVFLFISSFEIAKLIKKKKEKSLKLYIILLIFMTVFLHYYWHGPFGLFFNPVFWQNVAKQEFMLDYINKIPREGLLMTQNNIGSHFTRQEVILLKNDYKFFNPDVIAIDLRPGQNPNNFYPLTENDAKIIVGQIKKDPDYKNIYEKEENRLIFLKNKK